jgi:hypothetical protein
LQKKCEAVDYLSDYCGPLAVYYPKRIIQKDCISHPPLPSDIEGIEHCLDYIAFNASYPKVILKLKSVSKIPFEDSINTVFTVFNTNLITNNLISISYDVRQGESKIASGGIGDAKSNKIDCPTFCFDIKPTSRREFDLPSPASAYIIQSNMPFNVNGTYRYENSSSEIVSKQFNFTYQR